MRLLPLAIGAAVVAGVGLVFASERKGGTFTIMLGSQVVIPNTDENLNGLERDFGWPLESVATRYLSTTANGTAMGVTFRSDKHTPAMPAKGKTGTTVNGVPYKVLSVTQAPVRA